MRIYITGASGAGVTTLGRALATAQPLTHVDADDFYWMPTDPPFTEKRPPQDRVDLMRQELGDDDWVLTGSSDGWGNALIALADLIVFIETPTPVRLERLTQRESGRFGARIAPGGDMYDIHIAFREWASGYDIPGFNGRNRIRHEAWLAAQTATVLRLDGTQPTEALAEQVNATSASLVRCEA